MRPPLLFSECFKKRRYRTERYARKVAQHCLDVRGAHLRVYFCPTCSGWHLTSTQQPTAQPMAGQGEQ
jgi:hypothetical protein